MTTKPEVVFFYGPPFSGKALFYVYHFSQTHTKINPTALFEADPTLSLRAVILKVVNTLNQGQSVVVDDENSSKKTRRSYMTIVRNKVPQCSIRAIHFHSSVSSGLFICQWAREWELAHQFELSSVHTSLKLSEREIEKWFEKTTGPPSEEEGFNKIDKVNVWLVCETPYKFAVPALFLQWEGLFQYQEEQTNIHEAVVDVVKRWSHCNTYGRVIVLKLSEKKGCKVSAGKSCEWLDKIKQVISELVTQVTVPIFFVHLCSFLWQFSRPPNPGLFAWLQRLHNIDLSNRATFYVHSSDVHSKAATEAGVKCLKANRLFHNPQMINAVHCRVAAQVPEYVSKAKLVWLGSQTCRPVACIPLYHEAVTSHDSGSVQDMISQCVTVTKNSYAHGVCFKDFATLERFNLQYKQVATPTKPASGDTFNFGGCSSEPSTREEQPNGHMCSSDASGASGIPLHKSPACSKVDEKKLPHTICPTVLMKSLTTEKIESHAFSPGHFRRGENCTRLIRNVKSDMVEDGMLFIAKCIGSQGQFYDVSVVLGEKDLVRASCTCADTASKLGRCKHAVGLLLWCKNEKNMKEINKHSPTSNLEHVTRTPVKETMCDLSAENNQGETPLKLRKNKSLPKWISSLSQSTSSGEDRAKKTKSEDSPATSHHKRLKTKKNLESTIYCLSPEELLQTAQEILYEKSNPNKPEEAECSRRESRGSTHEERRSKQNSPYQGTCSRNRLKSSLNIDGFIKETIVRESYQDTQSNFTVDGPINEIIPETVAVSTLESHSTSPSVHEPLVRIAAGDLQNLTDHRKQGTTVRTSILDEFI